MKMTWEIWDTLYRGLNYLDNAETPDDPKEAKLEDEAIELASQWLDKNKPK